MASLAPHVSRVAKDYAPHGYSIMETSIVVQDIVNGATDEQYVLLAIADQSDIYLEGAYLVTVDEQASEGTNYWTFDLVSAPNGVGSETAISNQVGGASTAIAELTYSAFTLTGKVVSKGQSVWLRCNPNHASSAAHTVGGYLRFRIKA